VPLVDCVRRFFVIWTSIGLIWPERVLWLAEIFKGAVGPWIVYVLADDSYVYLDTLNIHAAFFSSLVSYPHVGSLSWS